MSSLRFVDPKGMEIDARAWVNQWADLFLSTGVRQEDDIVYKTLIEKSGRLSAPDFELIGRWKEGCIVAAGGKENGRWKPKTPAAYDVWVEATKNPPAYPASSEIDNILAERILTEWSEKTFDVSKKGATRFGVPRASTLLHFLSAGRFPIYDSLIWYALKRLGTALPWEVTVNVYLKNFCPLSNSLAVTCGLSQTTDDLRKLDNALRCYGGKQYRE